jgi:hypothetical protein
MLDLLLGKSRYPSHVHVYPDPVDEEAQQRACYGPFFKRLLPCYGNGNKRFLLGAVGSTTMVACSPSL